MGKEWEALKIDAILERQSPGQIAEPDRTSTMCEALKGYGKGWGLTVEVGTGHFSDKFCPFSGGGGGGGGVTYMSLAKAVWQ